MNLLAVNWTRDYNVRSWSRPSAMAAMDRSLSCLQLIH